MYVEAVFGPVRPLPAQRKTISFRVHDIDRDIGEALELGAIHGRNLLRPQEIRNAQGVSRQAGEARFGRRIPWLGHITGKDRISWLVTRFR
jgi:hypothetical protein